MLALRSIICIWTFAIFVRPQGFLGGQQYPPCSKKLSQGSQYIGCYDLSNEALELQITGTDPTLYSYYPGWIETNDPTAAALFDNSVDPANCTVACRGHGYKYAALYGASVCRCMGNAPSTLAPQSSTNPLDPLTLNSCHAPGQYVPGNCPGDSSQFCGTGTYADVYVDNSFPLLSTINPAVEENHYSYVGCFHPGSGGNTNIGLLSYRVPTANITGATSMTPCFEFCASLGFPFVEFDGGNSYTSCLCGSEISHGFQQLDSSCKGDCIGGSTCAGGNGCCGQRRSNTIYLNPDLVGCYEAPIPSASFVPGGPAQTYSEPTSGPTLVGNSETTASYPGPFVIATNPPSVPAFKIRYYNLGCWQRNSASMPIISGPYGPYIDNFGMTVESCLNSCFLGGYPYASLTNETALGFTCRCGNSFGSNAGQQPAASCHQLCPGNSPPETYEYCGGIAINEQVFGPAATVTAITMTTTTSSSTASQTISVSSSTTSTSPVTLDCQPDNCLRQFEVSSAVTPFCQTYTTALQTASTGFPPYVSQCQGNPSRVSSACSCIVTGSSSSQPLSITTTISPTTSTVTTSSETIVTTLSTIISSPIIGTVITSFETTVISITTTNTTPSSSGSAPTNTGLDCQPDNCLRQFRQSPSITAFCATYTTDIQTATTGLPPFVSQCSGSPSHISSACLCIVTGIPSSPPTISEVSLVTETSTLVTSTTTRTASPPPAQDCSPDNCYRQFQQSSAVTPFCETYTTALQTATAGLPPYVSQCQNIPSRISSACSCLVTVGSVGTTSATTETNTITPSETTGSSETSTSAPTITLPPPENCSPDNCYRQFEQSPAVTPFCASYTAALQTVSTGLPPFVSQCQSMPSRISSACSCLVGSSSLSMTNSIETSSITEEMSGTETTIPTGTTAPTSTATLPPAQNCSPDNCYRQFVQSPAVTPFCESYTATLQSATTGLPAFVSQCQENPARISSACSCVVTVSSPPSVTDTTTDIDSSSLTKTATPTETSTTISSPGLPNQDCSPDNCLRQFEQSPAVTPFCATYTATLQTASTGLPSFVSQCGNVASRISSACSCIVPTQIVTSISAPSAVETTSETPTASTAMSTPPVQNCSPDNCLRQFHQSSAEIATFCETYTTAIETASTGLPPFVSQCSGEVSRISSACSCISSAGSTSTGASVTSALSTAVASTASPPPPPPPPQDCSPDNCLRQFSQSLSEVSVFCSTYTTAIQMDTTGLPPFVSQCSSLTSRVSSACSCIVPPPTSPPTTSETSQTTNTPSSPSTTSICTPGYGEDCSSPSTTSSSPSSTTICTPSYDEDCSSPSTTSSSPSSTTVCTPGYDENCSIPSITSSSPSTTSICIPGYGEDCSSLTDTRSSSLINLTAPTTTVGTSTGTTSVSISNSSPTSTAGAPSILSIQPGTSGYYEKRQTYSQSFIGPGGSATTNCSAAIVYTIFNGQLFIDGQLVSTNPGTLYEPLSVLSGPIGTITTTFAINGNGFLTWQNLNFTNGEAYFCGQGIQIYALFDGLDNPGYPGDCEIVSLIPVPAVYCQNGVITATPPPSQSTQSSSAPNSGTINTTGSSGQTATIPGSLTGTTSNSGATSSSSGGSRSNAVGLPPNIYSVSQSGLVCVTTSPVLGDSGLTFEPMPTYMRREVQ